jgi:hypothetical protein
LNPSEAKKKKRKKIPNQKQTEKPQEIKEYLNLRDYL